MTKLTRAVFAVVIFLSGIMVMIIPRFILPVCTYKGFFVTTASGANIPMKCHYAMISEVLLGTILVLTGLIFFFVSSRQSIMALSGLVGWISILIIMVPVYFPGVCGNMKMPCYNGTRPGLMFAGVFIFLASAVSFFTALRNEEK